MKKKIFFLFVILITNISLGQEIQHLPIGEIVQTFPKSEVNLDPCSQSNSTDKYAFFGAIRPQSSQQIACDLFVEANTIFTFEQIITNFLIFGTLDSVDVIIWSDDNGTPNEILNSVVNLQPSSQEIIATSDQGEDVTELIYDLPSGLELEGENTGTRYWVQLIAYSSLGVGWHATLQNVEGLNLAVNQDNMGWMVNATNTEDTVYSFLGDCEPILGLDESSLSQQVILYPNPTSETLNIDLPSGVDVDQIDLFDLVGKNMRIDLVNSRLNLSGLSNGVYLLRIRTPEGNLVKKVVKSSK